MSSPRDGLARSVQVQLSRHARAIGVDPNLVMTRFAVERLLYRLSLSPHAERFLLKGALLMLAWLGDTLRPTRDADLLGFGDLEDDDLRRIFIDICATEGGDDAMVFLADTLRVEPIRAEDAYGGRRVTLVATLGAARLRVQVDVGIGDAVVPPPVWLDYPSLLSGLPQPRLRAYSPATKSPPSSRCPRSSCRSCSTVARPTSRTRSRRRRSICCRRPLRMRRPLPIGHSTKLAYGPQYTREYCRWWRRRMRENVRQ